MCWLTSQHLIFFFIFCIETPSTGYGPTNWSTEAHRQFNFHVFQNVWKPKDACRMVGTEEDVVLAARRAFEAAWLSEQILMYFCDLELFWISSTQAEKTYISARKTVVYLPRDTELPTLGLSVDSGSSPPLHYGPISIPDKPFRCRRRTNSPGPLFST
jgi:hypothetical protein